MVVLAQVIGLCKITFLYMSAENFKRHANVSATAKHPELRYYSRTYYDEDADDDLAEMAEYAQDEIVDRMRDFGWVLSGEMDIAAAVEGRPISTAQFLHGYSAFFKEAQEATPFEDEAQGATAAQEEEDEGKQDEDEDEAPPPALS